MPGVESDRYVALSYVWPENWTKTSDTTTRTKPVQLDRGQLADFKTPGFLKGVTASFPLVIQDAVSLVRTIGIKFLWVDRICIVQDAEDTISEVMRMNEIYNGA